MTGSPATPRRALLTFVAVGEGLNGTEIVAELHDFVLKALEDYPVLDPGEIRRALIERAIRRPATRADGRKTVRAIRRVSIPSWIKWFVSGIRG